MLAPGPKPPRPMRRKLETNVHISCFSFVAPRRIQFECRPGELRKGLAATPVVLRDTAEFMWFPRDCVEGPPPHNFYAHTSLIHNCPEEQIKNMFPCWPKGQFSLSESVANSRSSHVPELAGVNRWRAQRAGLQVCLLRRAFRCLPAGSSAHSCESMSILRVLILGIYEAAFAREIFIV